MDHLIFHHDLTLLGALESVEGSTRWCVLTYPCLGVDLRLFERDWLEFDLICVLEEMACFGAVADPLDIADVSEWDVAEVNTAKIVYISPYLFGIGGVLVFGTRGPFDQLPFEEADDLVLKAPTDDK